MGVHRLGWRRTSQGTIKMGERDGSRRLDRPLPQRRQIQPEEFADAPLGVPDLAVNLVDWEINELDRQIGQQGLELQALFQGLLGPVQRLDVFP